VWRARGRVFRRALVRDEAWSALCALCAPGSLEQRTVRQPPPAQPTRTQHSTKGSRALACDREHGPGPAHVACVSPHASAGTASAGACTSHLPTDRCVLMARARAHTGRRAAHTRTHARTRCTRGHTCESGEAELAPATRCGAERIQRAGRDEQRGHAPRQHTSVVDTPRVPQPQARAARAHKHTLRRTAPPPAPCSPISLLTAMTDTSAVSGRIASSSCPRFTRPSFSTGR
jgi:hypothetical protein